MIYFFLFSRRFQSIEAKRLFNTRQPVFALDHDVQNKTEGNLSKYKKIQEFAKSALVHPVVVNVGRAGAANLDVIQEIEFVKEEAKIVYLLECLQKTPPPAVIFAENKNDVDDIHEYLLLKGVEAVAIHGGKGMARWGK